MLVSDLINVRYLSGFTGSNAALLVFADDRPAVLATDGRYRTQAARQAPDVRTVIERACGPHLAGHAVAAGARRLGFESHVVTVDAFDVLQRACDRAARRASSWSAHRGRWRRCARSRTPARSPCCGWRARRPTRRWPTWWSAAGCGRVAPRRRSARDLEALMLDHGADGVSFETIVAAGAELGDPAPPARPTRCWQTGDFVKIDFGALVGGYHSDMTRTFVLGPAARLAARDLRPGGRPRSGRAARRWRPGWHCDDVDAASRQVIADAGYGETFGHGLGPRGRIADPRSAGNQRHRRRYTACWFRGHRGARCLLARPRRCPHRGHAGRDVGWDRTGTSTPELLTRFPKELQIL